MTDDTRNWLLLTLVLVLVMAAQTLEYRELSSEGVDACMHRCPAPSTEAGVNARAVLCDADPREWSLSDYERRL